MTHFQKLPALTAVLFLLLAMQIMLPQETAACRVLNNDDQAQWGLKNDILLPLQSLQRGPVRGPGQNGCTYIPGSGGAPCTEEKNFAGSAAVVAPSHARSGLMDPGGAAAKY
ncbi:hypothetical protein SLEP1_g842 [Rubroshorea leprosula]|uniref:Uncharacterized protein n=1 Tax=Rubroshorea leprosula TaxID=152421 RepID=A0AAV5HBW6_9ROSI|nr:hypothetical protein SLEP1_g842 [Rubroshorea leprosula]